MSGVRVCLNVMVVESGEVMLGFGDVDGDLMFFVIGDLCEVVVNLFYYLYVLDKLEVDGIVVVLIFNYGFGLVINDCL